MATPILWSVEAFDPDVDDWQAYVERLDQFFIANAIPKGERRVEVFLTMIGNKAYTLLRHILTPEKPSTKEYQFLVDSMQAHLKPKTIVISERFTFHRRNQRPGETIAQYITELKRLTEHCAFGDYREEALRDRLVCGMTSEAIQKRLLTEPELTFARAQQIAQSLEAASKGANDLRSSGIKEEGNTYKLRADVKACYRCGYTNHKQENCYFKTQRCRNCGKIGHMAKVCKSAKKPEPAASSGYKTERNEQHRAHYVVEEKPSEEAVVDEQEWGMFTVNAVQRKPDASIQLNVEVNEVPLVMAEHQCQLSRKRHGRMNCLELHCNNQIYS